jgi:riboflavin biosynthesis pyrimidine reductase
VAAASTARCWRVDELIVIVGPALDGGADSRTIVEAGGAGLKGRVKLSLRSCEPLAHGAVRLSYAVTPDDGA